MTRISWVLLALSVGVVGVAAFYFGQERGAMKAATAMQREPSPVERSSTPARRPSRARVEREVIEPAPEAPPPPAEVEAEAKEEPVQWTSAAEERDHMVARVANSGAPPAGLLDQIRSVEREWEARVASAKVPLRLGTWRCYGGGCTMTATYREGAEIEETLQRLGHSESLAAIPGQTFRSGAVQSPSGEFEVTWVILPSQQER